jgi:prophage maintenance system killer protein
MKNGRISGFIESNYLHLNGFALTSHDNGLVRNIMSRSENKKNKQRRER